MVKRENPAKLKPVLSASGTFQTLGRYRVRFKASLADCKAPADECFWGVIQHTKTIPFGDLASDKNISLYGLATALYLSTENLNDTHPLFPKGTTDLPMNEYLATVAATDAEGVQSDSYVNASTADERKASNVLHMIWILCENSIYQGDFVYKLVNQMIITGIVGFRNLPEDGDWTERLFQTQLGISAYDYFLALFGLWSLTQKFGHINTEKLIKDGSRKEELTKICQLVIDELSLKHNEYSKKAETAPYNTYSGKSLPLSLFSRWPLINLNDELYANAGHPFMTIQLTSKLLTKSLALARTEEKIGDTKYSQYLGLNRLEPFFSELCDIWQPSGGHYPEYEFEQKTNARSSDRIAFERHGSSNIAHLFQLKLKSLKEASHYGVSIDPVLSDLKGAFSKLVSQSVKFLFALQKSANANKLRDEHKALSRRILSADKYCFIGIVPDLPSVFVFKQLRDQVIQDVEAALLADEKDWYDKHLKGKFLWHIMELPEFETFITLPEKNRDFYKILSKYLRDSQIDRHAIDENGFLPRNFRSYAIMKYGTKKLPDGSRKLGLHQPDLGDLFEKLKLDVNRFFFGNPCSSGKPSDED